MLVKAPVLDKDALFNRLSYIFAPKEATVLYF